MDRDCEFYKVAGDVLNFLKEEHNSEIDAVKSGIISELFNVHKESLRRIVNFLRSEGYPVCSSVRGYWYSERVEDIDKTLSHLNGRLIGMNRAIEGLTRIRNKKDRK